MMLPTSRANQAIHKIKKPYLNLTKVTEMAEVNSMQSTPSVEMLPITEASVAKGVDAVTQKDNLTQATATQEIMLISEPTLPNLLPPLSSTTLSPFVEDNRNTNTTTASVSTSSPSSVPSTTASTTPLDPYCTPSLCELFNGTHFESVPHTACQNSGQFAPSCGKQPHLLQMSERRRNLILGLHNLARSRVASGQVPGYEPASHMPQIKWDSELEHLATLHVKRCSYSHDQCRNTPRFPYSGQNIGYYWIGREIKSHSRRMKNFIVNWFKEYMDADQTYVDSYHLHPEG